jgi:hypothetical protein
VSKLWGRLDAALNARGEAGKKSRRERFVRRLSIVDFSVWLRENTWGGGGGGVIIYAISNYEKFKKPDPSFFLF